MSISLTPIAGGQSPSLSRVRHCLSFGTLRKASTSKASTGNWKNPSPKRHRFGRGRGFVCSLNGDSNNAYGTPDFHSNAADHGDPVDENEAGQKTSKSNEILKKLRRYGVSGILSYGLLNTVYYLMAFLLVWLYVAPAPAKMGYFAAVERFLKVMAMVWVGSQVSKLVRAGGALALAPFVDRGLSWFTVKFNFQSQGKAFMAIVGICIGLVVILFFVITLLWA